MTSKNISNAADDDYREQQDDAVSPSAITFGDLVRDEQPTTQVSVEESGTLDAEFEETEELYQSAAQEINPALVLKENREGPVLPWVSALRDELTEALDGILTQVTKVLEYNICVDREIRILSKKVSRIAKARKAVSRTTGNPPGRPERKKPKLVVPPKKARKPSTTKATPGKKKTKPKSK